MQARQGAAIKIDGIEVSRIVRPESAEELSELLSNERGAVVPFGAGTQTTFGNPLRRADCAIDLKGLSRITEYVPADLTIHVEAGVTLEQLEHSLIENNQFLPLDPWNGPGATVGGIVAANAQGPFRAAGTIRDWIIGMKVVEIDGRISKAGGRVVKNVTGYDLQKLYTGSLGTLAVIVEISLKLRAKFARTATAVARLSDEEAAAECLSWLRKSPLQPVSCEWIGPDNEIWLRFGDDPRAVEWQLKNLPPAAEWTIVEGADETVAWERLRGRYNSFGPIVVRAIGLPTAVREIIEEYRPPAWIAHAMNGIVLLQGASAEEIRRIRQKYRVIIEKAPLETRHEVPTFGLSGAEYELTKKMKDAFDPEGRLNPGRHVDGERL
jgi:glycolate oxidase FAD binding subunit